MNSHSLHKLSLSTYYMPVIMQRAEATQRHPGVFALSVYLLGVEGGGGWHTGKSKEEGSDRS